MIILLIYKGLTTDIDGLISTRSKIRNYDGTNNNLKNPKYGSTNTNFRRLCLANYEDGIDQMNSKLPNARILSNNVGKIS